MTIISQSISHIEKYTKNSERLLFLIANELRIDPSAVYNVKPLKPGRLTTAQTEHLRRAIFALNKPKVTHANLTRARQHIEAVLAESEAP